jgi:hypothetical protein
MNRWVRRGGILSGLAVLATLASVPVFAPAAAAYACPRCYGLTEAAPGIYVEARSSEAERARLVDRVAAAEGRVAAFYAKRLATRPTILACVSRACDRRLGGGGAKARAYGATFIHVSPGGWNATILAHELAHIELHERIGWRALVSGALPAWFDEGLAVVVSRDPRYLSLDGDGTEACLEPASDDLPASAREWGREAGRADRPVYAMAACRVLYWLRGHGGRGAVIALAARLRDGGRFDEF